MSVEVVTTRSHAETERLGERIGRRLERGVVWLEGPLGSGKTALAKGVFKAHGIDPRRVTSPSFALVNRYRADPPLYHVDLYRLDTREALADLGLDDLFAEGGLSVVEWSERLEPGQAPDLVVRIEVLDAHGRRFELSWRSGSEVAPSGP